MSKAIVLLLVAILGCTYALHMQIYAPSKPGGTTYNPTPINGTSPGTSTQGTTNAYINGQPYVYNGPFTLACWLPSNTQSPYKWDTCWDATNCYRMLMDYKNCLGTVKKYPPVR